MIDCLIIGDSIAVGTAATKELHHCTSYAKGGINTWQFNKMYVNGHNNDFNANVVIISLGTNDHKYIHTTKELELTRSKLNAKQVYWVMPPCNDGFCKQDVNDAVNVIAEKYGDFIIYTQKVQKDNIHPTMQGYKELASQVK